MRVHAAAFCWRFAQAWAITPVMDSIAEQQKLDRLIERLNKQLPGPLSRFVEWLVSPSGRLVRLPLALLFIAGGIFSILPLLGIWMLPLGVILLAIDVPPVRRWVVNTAPKIEARWRAWRLRRAKQARAD